MFESLTMPLIPVVIASRSSTVHLKESIVLISIYAKYMPCQLPAEMSLLNGRAGCFFGRYRDGFYFFVRFFLGEADDSLVEIV